MQHTTLASVTGVHQWYQSLIFIQLQLDYIKKPLSLNTATISTIVEYSFCVIHFEKIKPIDWKLLYTDRSVKWAKPILGDRI